MATIEIPVRELHARTGHYVRKASREMDVIVTDRGRPMARLSPLTGARSEGARLTLGARRRLLPGYRAWLERGVPGGAAPEDSLHDEDRALRNL